jgi:DNA repair exonuclease SbcCD nuclease subunit
MLRFLHTSDWQLGHAPRTLAGEARARYADARFEAVERLGVAARENGCELVVVAGDVFDSNRVDRRTVVRGLDAMASIGLPVYLLPGNHDPLDAASVYRTAAFADHRPERVTVLAGREPVEVRPGVEVVGAPWSSKRPLADLVAELASELPPAPGGVRVAVAHGAVDALSPDRDDPARIGLAAAERAIAEGRFHYLALGDRHSATAVADRVRYSGTPEASDFGEERPGRALAVELDAGRCAVEEIEVGRWRFVRHDRRLAGDPGVEALAGWLEELGDKPRTALRLGLVGELSLHARARLDEVLAVAGERFASCELWAPRTDLVAMPDTVDRDALELSGFAAEAFEALLAEARGNEDPEAASGAVSLLYRLVGELGR